MTALLHNYFRMPKNFMTPNVIRYEQYGDRILELATGRGINDQKIWGVSELQKDSEARFGLSSTERSEMFYTLKEAEAYYKTLI